MTAPTPDKDEPKRCGITASFRYTWPGEDEAVACAICASKLEGVARAIGMHLQLILIDPETWPEEGPPTCTQKVKDRWR